MGQRDIEQGNYRPAIQVFSDMEKKEIYSACWLSLNFLIHKRLIFIKTKIVLARLTTVQYCF